MPVTALMTRARARTTHGTADGRRAGPRVCGAEAGAKSARAVKKLAKLKATLEHIVVEARARHWTSKVHEYQGKLVALAAAEARGAPNEAELV